MLRPVRRIITGHDDNGRSVVLSDGPAENVFESERTPGRGLINLWQTAQVPASNEGDHDNAARDIKIDLAPPANGINFRYFQIMPEATEEGLSDAERQQVAAERFKGMGGSHHLVDTSRHPHMHRTRTVDFIVLLEGRVKMLLDIGEVEMQPFDVVVQRGTNHAWVNESDRPALLMAVLVDADAL